MGNEQHRALIATDILLEPLNTVGIKMVGRLIKNQSVTWHHKRMSKGDPLALTTGERAHNGGQIVEAKLAKHCFGIRLKLPGTRHIKLMSQPAHALQ